MRRIRRITALFVSLLLANLVGVGSGFACVMPAMGHSSTASGGAASATGAAMAGMDMPGMVDLGGAADKSAPAHQDIPCKFPWAPEGCQSMAPCAPVAIASHESALDVAIGAPAHVAELTVLTPPSEVRTPDLPPPRA